MKYQVELSGHDMNLIETAIRLRAEAAEDNGDVYWAKRWRELRTRMFRNKIRINPNIKVLSEANR